MFERHNFHAMVSAAIIVVASSMPLHAEGLRGTVGGALGGLSGAVGDTVGGIKGGITGSVTSSVGATTATVGALTTKGLLSADAKSNLLRGIMAKARVLSPEELARLCLATGGGDTGCSSGNKPRILGIIDARLEVLSNKRLISVCASVGAGCGGGKNSGTHGGIAAVPADAVAAPSKAIAALLPDASPEVPANAEAPANASNSSDRLSSIAAKLSNSEAIVYKKRCSSVLRNPRAYENDIVQICKLIN